MYLKGKKKSCTAFKLPLVSYSVSGRNNFFLSFVAPLGQVRPFAVHRKKPKRISFPIFNIFPLIPTIIVRDINSVYQESKNML